MLSFFFNRQAHVFVEVVLNAEAIDTVAAEAARVANHEFVADVFSDFNVVVSGVVAAVCALVAGVVAFKHGAGTSGHIELVDAERSFQSVFDFGEHRHLQTDCQSVRARQVQIAAANVRVAQGEQLHNFFLRHFGAGRQFKVYIVRRLAVHVQENFCAADSAVCGKMYRRHERADLIKVQFAFPNIKH